MKKSYWKDRAKEAEAMLEGAETHLRWLTGEVHALRREVEDKRKNWTPIKKIHPWTPRAQSCALCDDPREDLRHQVEGRG